MRTFEERKAEVFLRSNERIRERKRNRLRILTMCIPFCLIMLGLVITMFPSNPAGNDSVGNALDGATGTNGSTTGESTETGEIVDPGEDADLYGKDSIDAGEFSGSFSITWNVFGISSYDSTTGKLVKTTDATNPEDYVTTLFLSDRQKYRIWELIRGLDIETYPEEYDPREGSMSSDPSMTLVLTVKTESFEKTVRAEDIALSYVSSDAKGQKFLDVCKGIVEILTSTEEWKALPEYEFLYD